MKMNESPVWYVMRFLYNRKSGTRERMERAGIETFVPMHYKVRLVNGRKVRSYVPVLGDMIFVRSTRVELAPYLASDSYFQFRYKRGGAQAEPLVVPDKDMDAFMTALRSSERPMYFTPAELNISKGTRIRIHGGPCDGMEGVFMKVKGARARRLVVELPNTIAVAVEINPDLIEVLADRPRPE